MKTMKAIVQHGYGSPDILKFQDTDVPAVGDDAALVRVHAASVNPVDWYGVAGLYLFRAMSGLRKPKDDRLGTDFAGTVEAVGTNHKRFHVGDEVFGTAGGAFAEYVCVREEGRAVIKPASLSFAEAAAVPVAAITALQALRDNGHVQPGQKVLINGASGGVGTFAVQIARSYGAEVSAVCSTRNMAMVASIGADHVIDYTREDFTKGDQRYDLIIDIAGSRSWSDCKRVLAAEATFVIVGGPHTNRWIGPLGHIVKTRLASVRASQKVVFVRASINEGDLVILRGLLEAGTVKPVIDRRYELRDVPAALSYLGEGHAKGKIVIDVAG
jgi:NADPH:quinone reductase-like Zn-dependent oxidoreductase